MPGRRLAAGASFGLRIVFVDSAKYVFPPSGRPGTPCVMLRSAVNYEDNFESCVCVLHITSFRLREFLPCKPICFKPTAQPPLPPPPPPSSLPPSSSAASMCQLSAHLPVSWIVIGQTDLNENLPIGCPRKAFDTRSTWIHWHHRNPQRGSQIRNHDAPNLQRSFPSGINDRLKREKISKTHKFRIR